MGAVIPWPSREPGRPYRWLLHLVDDDRPAPTCPTHRERTDNLGNCAACIYEWRLALDAVPADVWTYCRVCQMPIHPAVEAEGVETCPTCDDAFLGRKEAR